jgi:ferredoxin
MKVRVDGELCTGHGRCWTLAPDVYDADDEGFNSSAGGVVEVPPGSEDTALKGVRSCPEAALLVIEE